MQNPPSSAADPRPANRPYHILPNCPVCGRTLVLLDRDLPDKEAWHDEWECPVCQDGIHLDWPESIFAGLKAADR